MKRQRSKVAPKWPKHGRPGDICALGWEDATHAYGRVGVVDKDGHVKWGRTRRRKLPEQVRGTSESPE